MSQDEKSFRLKYVGARFEGARLPVDVLSDLAAFRDLVVAFAKDGWRTAHADRQRVPKGFDKSIAFDLVAIRDGSAVPVLNWNRKIAQENIFGFADELETIVGLSVEEVTRLIDNAGNDVFPKSLSSEYVRALNKLGSGLRDGERIEFPGINGRDGNVVYLDNVRRKKLITKVSENYQSRFESVGQFIGSSAPQDSEGHLQVRTAEHGDIQIPVASERIALEFDGNLYSDIQFEIQIELDNNDKYRSVIGVYDVALIDAHIGEKLQRCRSRLDEFRKLDNGWHDGAGVKISDHAFAAADKMLQKRLTLAGVYRIYPTVLGGILFEFEWNGWDYSIEFSPDGSLEFYGIQIDGDEELDVHAFAELNEEFFALLDGRLRK